MPKFTNLRKKVYRRRIETILLAGYAVAVTCALFVSMLNKNESRTVAERQFADENYDFNNDVMTPAFNDVKDNPFDILYAQVNNLKLLSNDEVITSKYTWWNFIFIFLYENLNPLNKFANFYFVCVAICEVRLCLYK